MQGIIKKESDFHHCCNITFFSTNNEIRFLTHHKPYNSIYNYNLTVKIPLISHWRFSFSLSASSLPFCLMKNCQNPDSHIIPPVRKCLPRTFMLPLHRSWDSTHMHAGTLLYYIYYIYHITYETHYIPSPFPANTKKRVPRNSPQDSWLKRRIPTLPQ